MIKLSVIVPVYNTGKYLEKCLNSLVNQTLKNIEIIIVDDGSTDNSKSIIKKYSKKYDNITPYYLKNGGVSRARNYGIKKAKGKYITFLDSDDYIDLNLYEKMYSKTKNNPDVVECDYIWEYSDKSVLDKYDNSINPMLAIRAVVWNKIYNKNFLNNTGVLFHEDVHFEDVEFCYELFLHQKTREYVDDAFVHYIQRKNSITDDKSDKLMNIYVVLDSTIKYYKNNKKYKKYKDELEYLYMRYTYGSSFKRILRVKDKKRRCELLKYGYNKLISAYPQYKKNKYLKMKTIKNIYYKSINKFTYKLYSNILRKIYRD